MNVAKWVIFGVLACGGALCALAADEPAPDPVKMATNDAIARIVDEIARTPINRNFTVGDVLQRTGGYDDLTRALERAEQVGGPRWLDDQTCQIQLQISGLRVSSIIQRIAVLHLRDLPVTLGELNRAIREWEERSFTATGTARVSKPSPVSVDVPSKVPLKLDQWPGIDKVQRERAIASAKLDAAQRAIRSVSAVSLTSRSTVGDVMAVRDVGAGMVTWFLDQPVSAVDLHPDLEAEVALKVTPAQAFDTFKGLAVKQKDVPVPSDEQGWASVKTQWAQRMVAPVGRAMLMAEPREAAGFSRRPMGLRGGRQQPDWIERRLQATADAPRIPGKSKLLAARAAENAAEKKLMSELLDLPYCGKTIAQAARGNDKIVDALRRAIRHARIAKTEYRDDGSATVEIYLDLADLWYELKSVE